MISSTLRKFAIGLAFISVSGLASADVPLRTFELGTLSTTISQSNIPITGSFDDLFKFTVGTQTGAIGSIVGLNFFGNLTMQYRLAWALS